MAGELADPPRDLPRAILTGTAIVTALYVGLNVVYALGVPVDELRSLAEDRGRSAVEPIAALAARRLLGESGARVATVAMVLVLLAALSAMVLTGPRVAFVWPVIAASPACSRGPRDAETCRGSRPGWSRWGR